MTPYEALRQLPPFDAMSADTFDGLDGVRRIELDAGAVLTSAGDPADEVFVLLEGEVAVVGPDGRGEAPLLATLGAGSVVGEIAALTGATRSATLAAVSPIAAIAIDATTFAALLERNPGLGIELAGTASSRLQETRLAGQLQRAFPGADAAALGALAGRAEFVALPAGGVLFHEGDDADAAYIVVAGRVRILGTDEEGHASRPIAEVGAGELIGELALLDDASRSATVVAARDSQLARLPREGFEAWVTAQPEAMLTVTRTIVTRLRDVRDTYRRARSDHAAIGLVPLSPSVDLDRLGEHLDGRLRAVGSVARLTRDRVDRMLGIDGIAQARPGEAHALRLLHRLDEVEEQHDLLVLQGDPEATPWTRRCVERVDHLVLVADARDAPDVTELERLLISTRELPHQRVSLLLLHPDETLRPSGTAAWLAPRDLDDHLHVRHNHAGDLDRLARHLTGRSVWLVLGGGGGKGFAHLGVARAMAEVGIPIDGVAGASIGAVMAAGIAHGGPADGLVDLAQPLFADLLDYTVPVSGLIAARRITASIHRFCDGRDIEDLWYPYLCVSANLTRSQLVTHRRGDLARAMRASCSIPGVMPPVAMDDDLLVDGGVMNNLPVDIVRRLNPTGVVIASDVAPRLGPKAKGDHGLVVSGTRVVLRRITPGVRAAQVPRIVPTLMRSLLLASAEARDRGVAAQLADLHLAFELRGVGILDFDHADAVADRGYQESIELLTTFAAASQLRWSSVG